MMSSSTIVAVADELLTDGLMKKGALSLIFTTSTVKLVTVDLDGIPSSVAVTVS